MFMLQRESVSQRRLWRTECELQMGHHSERTVSRSIAWQLDTPAKNMKPSALEYRFCWERVMSTQTNHGAAQRSITPELLSSCGTHAILRVFLAINPRIKDQRMPRATGSDLLTPKISITPN